MPYVFVVRLQYPFYLLNPKILFSVIYHVLSMFDSYCVINYILLMHVILTFSGRSALRESWQAELNQTLCNEKDVMLIYAKRHVFLFMIVFLYHKLVVCNAVQTLQLTFFEIRRPLTSLYCTNY
jgi:hypothetical protein